MDTIFECSYLSYLYQCSYLFLFALFVFVLFVLFVFECSYLCVTTRGIEVGHSKCLQMRTEGEGYHVSCFFMFFMFYIDIDRHCFILLLLLLLLLLNVFALAIS